MIHIHKYGLIRSKKDSRDHKFSFIHAARIPAVLPPATHNAGYNSPVRDQGQIGCCTGEAHSAAIEYLAIKSGIPFTPLSPLFPYTLARIVEGTLDQDAGASPRDIIQVLAKQGICQEALWPLDPAKISVDPTPDCYIEASNHQITAYQSLQTLDDIKACLALGYGFTFGIQVFPSMETDKVNASGDIPMPTRREKLFRKSLGGHDLFGYDYDDSIKMVLFKNSWNTTWGKMGHGRIPYAYLQDPELAYDFWTVQGDESFVYGKGV
jgi:C1A family cysteine protease